MKINDSLCKISWKFGITIRCRFHFILKSQAVGIDSWVQTALKSILRGDPIFESAAWFFVIMLKFIFTSIFESKIHEKNPWHQKKSFSKADLLLTADL